MIDPAEGAASYRVLLVGIDAYQVRPLSGCVNDIDAVQRILRERVGVPADRIRRLASPHPGAAHATEIPEQPATLEKLKAELARLAAEAEPGDRVLLYYSGHGSRVDVRRPDGSVFHREALAPVDVDEGPADRLLYDHELNEALGQLRTRAVTVVLDCCHSAGASRHEEARLRELTPRVLYARRDLGLAEPIPDRGAGAGAGADAARGDGAMRTIDHCHVVAACLNHELAREAPAEDGRTHGLLTRALVRALAQVPDAELPSVPWSRIWQAMRAEVEAQNPFQHLWMAGNAGRAVIGGLPVDGDPGFSVRRAGGDYELDAGTLASVTDGALVAIYGPGPGRFPPVDSPADRDARLGTVRVTRARDSSALAAAVGEAFAVPPGARGRIVEPGAAAQLRCAIVPANEALEQALARSPLLEVVAPGQARVRLERAGDRWLLTDDLHGAEPGTELFAFAAAAPEQARAVLEHYFYYALPLRMAESATDLPGQLELRVLACPEALSPAAAEVAGLAEAPTTAGSSLYDLREGDRICIRVTNRSRVQLLVTLVNAASSGAVEVFDTQSIDAGAAHTFWLDNTVGAPFEANVPDGRCQGIDRLVAVGTTSSKDVGYLQLEGGFADALGGAPRNLGRPRRPHPPVELWTATSVLIRTRAR